MAERRARHPAPIVDVAYLAGGAALVASAFVPWVARGTGSGLRGHALVDAVVALGRHDPALSAGRITVLWYVVPVLGALSWIACGLAGPCHVVARTVALAALVATLAAGAAFVHLVGVDRLGWGPKLAIGGALVACLAAWLPVPARDGDRRVTAEI